MQQVREHAECAHLLAFNFISSSNEWSSGLECLLREMLDSAPGLNADLRTWNVEAEEDAFNLQKLCDDISRCRQSLLLVVLNADSLETACRWLSELWKCLPALPVVALTEAIEAEEIQRLLELGVSDFIAAPFKPIDVIPRVRRCLEQSLSRPSLVHALKERLGLEQLIGESPVFRKGVEKIPRLARCDANVLIAGETGTGKELCACAIHYLSRRAGGPFIPVNCGAIPLELVENELFGHERGAYTGAVAAQSGLIAEADGGTLFLDEVDCLPPMAQVKLLRFLQEKEFRTLGSTRTNHADVRIIAASNTDFREAVKSGRLRQDLYYRLNVLSLSLPPLRARREDIPLLARHFLVKYAGKFDSPAKQLSSGALAKLAGYDWPGNVRELENAVERAVAFSENAILHGGDLDLDASEATAVIPLPQSFQEAKALCVAQFEQDYVRELLRLYQGNITRAAQAARKDRRAFWQLIRKHGIDARSFKPGRQAGQ